MPTRDSFVHIGFLLVSVKSPRFAEECSFENGLKDLLVFLLMCTTFSPTLPLSRDHEDL